MISLWIFFCLVGGEVSRSQHHQSLGSNQSWVYEFMGSIPLFTVSFFYLEGVSVSAKQLKDVVVCNGGWGWEGTRTLPQGCTVFLDCLFPPGLTSSPFPN